MSKSIFLCVGSLEQNFVSVIFPIAICGLIRRVRNSKNLMDVSDLLQYVNIRRLKIYSHWLELVTALKRP